MNIDIKSIFDITKLPSKFFILFSTISAAILFLDNNILKRFKLDTLTDKYGWIVGLTFFFSIGLVLINIIIWIYNKIEYQFKFRKVKNNYILKIKNLDSLEKSVVREFYLTKTNTLQVPIDNPIITSLIDKNIIYINQSFGNGFLLTGRMETSVSLSDFVRKNLDINHLGIPPNLTDLDIKKLEENRPYWLKR